MQFKILHVLSIFCLVYFFISCKKLVEIDPPANTIVTEQAFQDSANASSAVLGIYGNMMNSSFNFMNGILTIDLGKAADELVPLGSSGDKLYSNSLTLTDGGSTRDDIWVPAYQYIYQANACIDGIQASNGISDAAKKQFTGEVKFLRAICYFYLTNLFGDVPYITSTDFNVTSSAPNTPQQQIYQQIVSDLQSAQELLPRDYSISSNERVRANYWAATALLARVYLYLGDWVNAEMQSSLIINQPDLFSLTMDLNSVFLVAGPGNNEPILQWSKNTEAAYYNGTPEGVYIIPNDPPENYPPIYVNDLLLNAFEDSDMRRTAWIDSTAYGEPAIVYYYPFKYKIGQTKISAGGPAIEYVTVLRLAEQFLIRAEAKAQQNKLTEALEDVNMIRRRAHLPDLLDTPDQQVVLAAIAQERRIELFAEWGHRWLDLKRTRQIDAVMSVATPLKGQGTDWTSHQQLFPMPYSEILYDPSLKQNPGY